MRMDIFKKCQYLGLLAILVFFSACSATGNKTHSNETFVNLVIAPDRGFAGNQEVRDALATLKSAETYLLFADEENGKLYFDELASKLQGREVLVLPLFISAQQQHWQLAKQWLQANLCTKNRCRYAKVYGESYFAVEAFAAGLNKPEMQDHNSSHAHHLRAGHAPGLLVISHANAEQAEAVSEDITRIAGWATEHRNYSSVNTFIWQDTDSDEAYKQQQQRLQTAVEGQHLKIVSYHQGFKLDGMMSLDSTLTRTLRKVGTQLTTLSPGTQSFARWIQREHNRRALNKNNIGVVLHAHGSDFHWNESMRRSVAKLEKQYLIEYAFSMADQSDIEAALQRLQARGAKGAIVLRVFGRSDSFASTINHMLGLDVESGKAPPAAGVNTAHGHGHPMMGGGPRIQTPLVLTTVGGLDDDPLFAEALLERAQALSLTPANERVILVAHGTGSDSANARWVELLESLSKQIAEQIHKQSGEQFSEIQFATWREDWPEKRKPWIAMVRSWVEEAKAKGETVIVIPARTNATGPEHEFLQGLDYKLGEGFAGHPLFVAWVEKQTRIGIEQLSAY